MLKNNGKIVISKNFLFSLLVICLMFTSVGLFVDHSYAVDLNETNDEIELENGIEDKLINSQENEILEVDSQDDNVLSQDSEQIEPVGATITVSGNKFSDIQTAINNARSGDTISLKGTTYTASDENSRIVVDKKVNIVGTSGTVLNAKSLTYCFYLKTAAASTTIKNIKFINGKFTLGSCIKVNATNILIENCAFENNHCNRAGAISTAYDLETTKNLIVRNCNFTKNTGYHDGYSDYSAASAIAAYGLNSQIINCIFDSNWVRGEHDTFGGAIQVGMDLPGSNVKVTGCTFINNRAISANGDSHGGAGCVRTGTEYRDCIFINNQADMGGALTCHASGSIINCKFINNVATSQYGGAISTGFLYDDMELNIINCEFEGNRAPQGGAIQAKGEDVHVTDSKFTNNSATTYGGAIYIEATGVSIKDSKFNSNIANVDGGALYIEGSNTVVEGSSFLSNEAIPDVEKINDGLGGAIYVKSTIANIKNNEFMYNTARNGSAIYYDKLGDKLTLIDNTLYQNQAWVYRLPISAEDIYYGDSEDIKVVLHGGNNIADYDNLAVSNAIYNAADYNKLEINGEFPISGATDSGELFQDDREYHINVLLTVQHEDGTVVYNNTLNTNYLGAVNVDLDNLKEGKYLVSAKHFEDTYYKAITNTTSFRVIPKVDDVIVKGTSSSSYDYEEIVVWTITVTNNGPSNSTEVVAYDVLPEGLIWLSDTSGGKYNPQTGKLEIGFLEVGETLTFDIITVVNKTGEITNKVNITSNEYDYDLSNNYGEDTIHVNPASDLAVVKSVSNAHPNYKDEITWTIEVSNNGPDDAHDVVVRDVLPDSLIFMECNGNYDPNSGIWRIGTLKANDKIRLNIRCSVNKTGLIINNVSVEGNEFDYDLSNNNGSERIAVDPSCDLSISKSVNASEVNYGDYVKWTLTVSNNGPDSANNVVIKDALPKGFVYCDSTLAYDNDEFKISKIKPGETVVIDIVSKVDITGEFTNVASVSSDEYDYDLTNNEDDEDIMVNPASDLSVSKEVDNLEPKFGENIIWTIVVTNNGPDVAHDIIVVDKLPDSLIWIGDDSQNRYNPQTGVWNIDHLDVDDSVTLNIECMVNGTGTFQNNVSVMAKEFDFNLTNNEANETVDVESSADVSVAKMVNNSNPYYQDFVKWTLVISNKGPDKATDVYVEDALPSGLVLINYTATKGFYDNGMWAMCCLEPGESETLEIVCKVNRTGKITNIAVINANEHDPDYSNNNATVSIDVPLAVDVEVIMNVNNTDPVFGEVVSWMVQVKNNGPDTASDVVLDDILPAGLQLAGFKSTKGNYANYDWNIGELKAGESQYLNISTIANALGKITNGANVDSLEFDWNRANNFDNSQINVMPVADLSITKSVDNSNPNYKDVITWTLTAYNDGPNKASNVKVFDTLPKGLTFISSNGQYSNGVWDVGSLDVGETKLLEIVCRVTSTGEFTNVVNIVGDELDLNPDNDNAEESIFVKPASDLSITKIASKYYYMLGEVIEYVIEVVNNGPDTARNVKVNEILGESLNLKSLKVTKGHVDESTLDWTMDSLGYGESARLYVKAVADSTGVLKNAANVTSDNYDDDMGNNDDFSLVEVSKKPENPKSESPNKPKSPEKQDVPDKKADIPDKKSEISKNKAVSSLKKKVMTVLEKHPTSNPFAILMFSLLFSIIFLGGRISKKR